MGEARERDKWTEALVAQCGRLCKWPPGDLIQCCVHSPFLLTLLSPGDPSRADMATTGCDRFCSQSGCVLLPFIFFVTSFPAHSIEKRRNVLIFS